MERYIIEHLKTWKENPDRKPLILLGARQVGKTYILKEFGKREYKHCIYINCRNNKFADKLFIEDFDTKRILYTIATAYDTPIIPGETLLIFDEIQEIKNGIASLKYFCEDAREYHVVVAGSLLGISLKEDESYPVGKVNTMKMYPMTFKEYLLACGKNALYKAIENLDWPVLKTIDSQIIEYLRQYYFVGGMPEAVAAYIKTKNTAKVREIQGEILEAYYRDISKHSKAMVTRIRQVWDSVPMQLAKENKKFIFGAIRKGARANDFELAIQWLVDAGLVYKINRCLTPDQPLKFYIDDSAFKIYMLDIGLLAALSNAQPKEILIGDNAFVEFKGSLTENFVLQQLITIFSERPYYYSKENSTMEIDYLLQCGSRIVPIEVKAEENVKSKSMSQFINVDYKQKHLKGVRCSMLPYIDQEWMENVPLFAINDYFAKMREQELS